MITFDSLRKSLRYVQQICPLWIKASETEGAKGLFIVLWSYTTRNSQHQEVNPTFYNKYFSKTTDPDDLIEGERAV